MTFIFADESNPLEINTSTSFIDNEFGADIQGQVNDAFFGFVPSLAYDTWLTIGDSYSSAAQTTPGFDLSSGFSGSSLSLGGSVNSDIAVFRTPDDPLCLPNSDGYVLLGQFTTTGVLSGYINLMGQDANGNPWTESNIPIPSIEVEVLGCTDPTALNYDSSANSQSSLMMDLVFLIGMVLRIQSGTYTFTNAVGCDSALNYDSSANTDDGSCIYSSTLVGLVIETVDNSSEEDGFSFDGEITYNLYAELDGGLVTFIFNYLMRRSNPLEINTSTSFIDNQFGADIQGQVNDAFFGFVPSLAYDI